MVAIIPSLLKTWHREKDEKIIDNCFYKCRIDGEFERMRVQRTPIL